MSHESFDDPKIAELINEHFIAIKVDREQHPLVDDTYMLATQAMTGAGGWPMTVFTLPDGRAFHTGTYYPATPRGKMPSFSQVLHAVQEAYSQRREAVQQQAEALVEHLAQLSSGQNQMAGYAPAAAIAGTALDAATATWITRTQDSGGFTPAPKFPPTQSLLVMWQQLLCTAEPEQLFDAAATSTEALLLGGLHDHLNGGFARYCVDEAWAVPHFEKMLYDNAQLLRMLASCYAVSTLLGAEIQDPYRQQRAQNLARAAQRAVHGIVHWLERAMLCGEPTTANRAFAASLDADSLRDTRQAEGAYYTFSSAEREYLMAQLTHHLPEDLVRWVEVADDPGYFCLSLARMPEPAHWAYWDELLEQARKLVVGRALPARDEKVIAGWNGLAIEALCHAAIIMQRPDYRDLAEQVGQSLWTSHLEHSNGRLARTSFAAVADHQNEGTLEDYASLSLGFAALAAGNSSGLWAQRAQQLLDQGLKFIDQQGLARDAVQLDQVLSAQRGQQPAANLLDDAIPSAASLLARVLTTRAVVLMASDDSGDQTQQYLDQAATLVSHANLIAGKFPTAVAGALEVQGQLQRPVQYLSFAGHEAHGPGSWRTIAQVLGMAVGPANESQTSNPDGSIRIYPCRFTICQAPLSNGQQLLERLRAN